MASCPKCGHKAIKNGLRPIRRKGAIGKRQCYICTNPKCWHQFEGK